jgi:hypothetical protein
MFYNNLWFFNQYNEWDTVGALYKFDAHTGIYITHYADAEYKDVTASTFANTVIGGTTHYDALIYQKGTNLKFVNVDNMQNYEVMTMDNLEDNDSTVIPVWDLAVDGSTIYRLQTKATYYGTTYDWSTNNYVVSVSSPFLDSITVTAIPVIIPANGYNYIEIKAIVLDQFSNGVIYQPVLFTDDDDNGFLTSNPAYTDLFFGTGEAITSYRAGTEVRTVNIEGTATQYDN